ncbi:Protein of unknown function [Pyronema omphalodes CBS 100304]|uniref:Uncharacterized protein n=1 Tax=Pyronema omphalodes (strain CBS 100304) TaxID=1076935 RepID=U4LAK1_PYROM|nr:Protein of unknown function [Pyronema omphalodes CBS 100304]
MMIRDPGDASSEDALTCKFNFGPTTTSRSMTSVVVINLVVKYSYRAIRVFMVRYSC